MTGGISKRFSNSKVKLCAVFADADIGRKANLVFLRQNESGADTGRRQEVLAELAEIVGDLSESGETGEYPSIIEMPTILGLHSVHLVITIAAPGVAAKILATAEGAQ